jgi:hypothetical protein
LAALAASPWLLQQRHRADWRPLLMAGTLGYATHGVLDACTNYGTHLLWPFSPLRVAWHWITTIGPLLTLILLFGWCFAVRRRSRLPALLALLLAVGYVGLAAWQRERALDVQAQIAAARGHPVTRAEMFPTVGNPILWRSVYQSGETLYTDRLRRPRRRPHTLWKRAATSKLLLEKTICRRRPRRSSASAVTLPASAISRPAGRRLPTAIRASSATPAIRCAPMPSNRSGESASTRHCVPHRVGRLAAGTAYRSANCGARSAVRPRATAACQT